MEMMTDHSVKFMGPAHREFPSFNDHANYFMDTFWPGWKNYEDPQSYLMPPVFRYKRPEVSDEAFEAALDKGRDRPSAMITDRIADKAKHVVYNSIQKVIDHQIKGPFIAIRNLDFRLNFDNNGKLMGPLVQIFPDLNWGQFLKLMRNKPSTTFDFILIGPKIGLVAIEVQCSPFAGHFIPEDKSLPRRYKESLDRLELTEALVYFLRESTGISAPDFPVHKILFTPNLEKTRYNSWLATLNDGNRDYVKERLHGTVQWFREDVENFGDSRLEKQSVLKILLANLEKCRPLDKGVYEAYAPIVSAMASMAVFRARPRMDVSLTEQNYSTSDAFLKESLRVTNQNPLEGEGATRDPESLLKYPSNTLERDASRTRNEAATVHSQETKATGGIQISKVMLLSGDQQVARKGPPRQFIIGAAGTGKTIVLQAKALELLAKGRSVTVLAPKSYMLHYKTLFDSYGFTKYKIQYWANETIKETYQLIRYLSDQELPEDQLIKSIYQYVEKKIMEPNCKMRESFKWLLATDLAIIDDAFDKDDVDFVRPERFYAAPLLIMAFAAKVCPQKTVWAALDLRTSYGISGNGQNDEFTSKITNQLLKRVRMEGEKAVETKAQVKIGGERLLGKRLIKAKKEHEAGSPGEKITDNESFRKSEESYFSVSVLKRVMRCSENIFWAAYDDAKKEMAPEVVPMSGHKIQGAQVTTIKENYQNYQQALQALWQKMDQEIARLKNQGFRMDDTAVVIGASPKTHSNVSQYIRQQCEKYWPDQINTQFYIDAFTEMTPRTEVKAKPNVMSVEDWYKVSSLEWPVVIYVSCLPKNLDPSEAKHVSYQRYRALTRATSVLVDITITHETPETLKAINIEANKVFSAEGWNYELEILGDIPATSGPLELPVQNVENAPARIGKLNFYHSCTQPRGVALIINNEKFDGVMADRIGSKVDAENVRKLAMGLGYWVRQFENLTARQMQDLINLFVSFCDQFEFGDSCIVYLSTYAKGGNFIGVDGDSIRIHSFFNPLTKSEKLKGKVKFFIIQACREPTPAQPDSTDVDMMDEIEDSEWKAQEDFLKNIPNAEDTCILHSTTPGYYSWRRDHEHGSWFVQTICEVFSQYAHEPWADLTTLITLTNKRLHEAFKDQPNLLLMNATMIDISKSFHFFSEEMCEKCSKKVTEIQPAQPVTTTRSSEVVDSMIEMDDEEAKAEEKRIAALAKRNPLYKENNFYTETMRNANNNLRPQTVQ